MLNKKTFKATLYFIPIVIFFLSGEIITRTFVQHHILTPPYDHALKDEVLGWRMKPNYTYSGIMKDSKNKPYPVQLHYNQDGFKAFGEVASKKTKIFFIGDSYTSSIEVSNDKSFFNLGFTMLITENFEIRIKFCSFMAMAGGILTFRHCHFRDMSKKAKKICLFNLLYAQNRYSVH